MKRKMRRIIALTAAISIVFSFAAYGGWKREDGIWRYYDKNGNMMKNCFKKAGKNDFYLDENGDMVVSCEKVIGIYRYKFDERGLSALVGLSNPGQSSYVEGDYALNRQQQLLNKTDNPYEGNQVVQWFNAACAIPIRSEGGNIRAFGGFLLAGDANGKSKADKLNDANTVKQVKAILANDWGVTSKASADKCLATLVQKGSKESSAWYYGSAIMGLGFFHLAGYYDIDESLDKSLDVARAIQASFKSWDAFAADYLDGYHAWAGDKNDGREVVYEGLKASAYNPYGLAWDMELEKNW